MASDSRAAAQPPNTAEESQLKYEDLYKNHTTFRASIARTTQPLRNVTPATSSSLVNARTLHIQEGASAGIGVEFQVFLSFFKCDLVSMSLKM
jgi:hypothetical protein